MMLKDYDYVSPLEFQNLVAELFNKKECTNTYMVFGRQGQKQDGIDIYSPETLTGIQCKLKNGNQQLNTVRNQLIKELEKEFLSFFNSDLPFEQFILVSTFPHDVEIQKVAYKLSKKYNKTINYMGWDIIKSDLIKYPGLVYKYFGQYDISYHSINLISCHIDKSLCDWVNDNDRNNSYRGSQNTHSNPFPVFDFRFINNTNSPIILNRIYVGVKEIPRISGIPKAGILNSEIKYKLLIDMNKSVNTFYLENPIYVCPQMPFRFHVELLEKLYKRNDYGIFSSGYYINFTFEFNENIKVKTQEIVLSA